MAAITPETLHAVAAELGLEVDRFEETRPGRRLAMSRVLPTRTSPRELRLDLADWAAFAMTEAEKSVAENNLLELPRTIVHGDFATWNLHFTDGRLSGVIDFDLTHQDSRSWEFMIARVCRAPELIEGYQPTAKELGNPLTEAELAAIPLMHGVFRVNMVMAELWSGPRESFDLPMIERQLGLTGTPKP